MEDFKIEVKKGESKERLDKYLCYKIGEDFSRTYIQDLISQGRVKVNDKEVKNHYKIKQGEKIKVSIPDSKESSFKSIPYNLDIRYEDEEIIVVNKPPNLIVHPISKYRNKGDRPTLVNALLFHCKDLSHIGGELKPGIIHRLDKETSGVIISAKTDAAHRKLARQFKNREVKKVYLAIVEGKVKLDQGRINLPIGRTTSEKVKMSVSYIEGKSAQTYYEVIERFQDYTLLKVIPKTGRTHQIRVHLSYIDHPIIGDKKYGTGKLMDRQALHAYSLTVKHPKTNQIKKFVIPLPKDMRNLVPFSKIENQN